MKCHAEDLKSGDDSHPKSKFTDPRNAARVSKLDARYCITCHIEHKPERTQAMGVTLPDDFCFQCHQDIAKDRPSHRDLSFDTCASSGCHNFHDNRGLYEDFLVKHGAEEKTFDPAQLPVNMPNTLRRAIIQPSLDPLTVQQADSPERVRKHQDVAYDWEATAHAQAGVNCNACHVVDYQDTAGAIWRDKPDHRACQGCHEQEVEGFKGGLHGMRVAQDMPAVRPMDAQIPMHPERAEQHLSCISCHSAHRFERAYAASQACMSCHADEHSKNYVHSPHAMLWHQEQAGVAAPGTGVSCASCHLPKEKHLQQGVEVWLAAHNQNANLRPNEKMLRTVCMNCHGLGFAIDALADAELVRRNFTGSPAKHIPSIDWALNRVSK